MFAARNEHVGRRFGNHPPSTMIPFSGPMLMRGADITSADPRSTANLE